MLAVWCLLIPALSAFVVGLPIRGLLAREKALDEAAWVQVPFIGIAVTVLLLQLQVHLDIPVNRGVFPLALLILGLWAIWLWRGQVKESFRSVPVPIFAVCTGVVIVHSLGLFARGPDDYVGRTWSDQFNYTCMAECFRTQGYKLNVEDNYQSAWLGRVARLKEFRIGQSVLQAYHGVITRLPTRTHFMPTVLLSFPLIALAAFAAVRQAGLQQRIALFAALFAGLVPGVSILGLESFQSHVWGIPFFLMLPSALSAFNADRSAAACATAALCLSALTSLYTEFLVFELMMVGGFFVLALAQRVFGIRLLLGYSLMLSAPWLCNPLYYNMNVFLYSASLRQPYVLEHIYPWAYESVGLGLIWFGDYCLDDHKEGALLFASLLGQGVLFTGMIGLVIFAVAGVVRWWRGGFRVTPGGFDLRLALLGVALIPVVMLLQSQEFPYQYYKLLLTVSPLFALGAVVLGGFAARLVSIILGNSHVLRGIAKLSLWLPIVAAASIAAVGTGRIALRSADSRRDFRTSQYIALRSDFRQLRQQLEGMHGQNILLEPPHKDRVYHHLWTLYFARKNNLWLTWPHHNDAFTLEKLSLGHLNDLSTLPSQFLVLCPREGSMMLPPTSLPAPEVVWQNKTHLLWQFDGRPWACAIDVDNPNGDNQELCSGIWLGGGGSMLQLLATESGVGKLRVHIQKGPCLDPSEALQLLVTEPSGTSYVLELEDGEVTLPISMQRGQNRVALEVLNRQICSADGDPRPLLARLRIQEVTLTPDSMAGSPDRLIRRD